jgi:predicted RNA-binding Zn-ribbon protein involved in translation (DUF1610 family)
MRRDDLVDQPRGDNMVAMRRFHCYACEHQWEEPHGTGRPMSCPACGSTNIHRSELDKGPRGGMCASGRGPSENGRGRGGAGRGPRQGE